MWSGWPLATQEGRHGDGGEGGDGVPTLDIPVHYPGMIPSINRHKLNTCCVHDKTTNSSNKSRLSLSISRLCATCFSYLI